jgi:hypothetical protein
MLTFEDEGTYFPNNLIDPIKFPSAIAYLTAIAEGPLGAQRSLSQKQFVERQSLHSAQREYFVKYWPIDLTEPIAIEMRWINCRNRFRRSIPDSEWELLDHYEVDDRAIRFVDSDSNLFQDFGRSRASHGQKEIKVVYTGGFDFNVVSPEVAGLKYAMGQLLEYHVQNMGADMRIQREDVYQESSTTYFGVASKGSEPGTVAMGGFPEHLLIPFQAYRPYVYRF